MDQTDHDQHLPAAPARATTPTRLPRPRMTALLAAAMLGIGVAAGAALGPGPESSIAGAGEIRQELPALLAAIAARERAAQAAAGPSSPAPAPTAPEATGAVRPRSHAKTAAGSGTPATPTAAEPAPSGSHPSSATTRKLPATSAVWLIELSGSSFANALAAPAAAPYLDGEAVPGGALVSSWSAAQASAFASDAALAEPPSPGGPPALMHTIVQPPCPEGAAGAACAPETPGQLTVADTFLKETLATITGTPAYREHGLVVVTFATVAVPTQAGLAAGTASATLTTQPPAGALLISPFVRAGSRPATAFDATSPRRSLEALLH